MQSCPAETSPFVALVTDTCVSCAPDEINLHVSAFQQYLGDPSQTTTGITYEEVGKRMTLLLKSR